MKGREREPLLRSEAEDAEDHYWERLYGGFDWLDPVGMRDFFAGFERPWWVVGGWAIEAFTFEHGTGAPREHEDIDVSILVSDVPALRSHVGESWQLWNIADGAMRPLTDLWPDVQHPESQIWGRRGAGSAATSNRTWPLMDDRAREWLREKVTLLHPGHAWLDRLR